MSEDERTLWCGNLSESVTEEMLYELFLQAGPLENIKIPRDADRRQRSYAFITFTHACSVEYAMNIFEGTALLQRPLTLHRKTRNGSNANNALAQTNFNHPTGSSSSTNSHTGKRFSNDPVPVHFSPAQQQPLDSFASLDKNQDGRNVVQGDNDILAAMSIALNSGPQYVFTPELLAQLGQHMLGADLPPLDDGQQQQSSLRTKMLNNDRSHYRDRHQHKPYSRDDRYDRNDSHNRHRYDGNSGRKSNDHEKDNHRHNRRRR